MTGRQIAGCGFRQRQRPAAYSPFSRREGHPDCAFLVVLIANLEFGWRFV
jgi:hypothetical protein